jgi:arginine/lysine/ornithine decarboxylase
LGRLKSALQWLQSSSPSYVLLASLDAARWQLAQEGKERLRRLWEQAEQLRRRWQALAGVDVFGGVEGTLAAPFQMDITKLTLAVRGWSGHAAAAQLRRLGIAVEWADEERLLLLLSLADVEQDWERLEKALLQLLQMPISGILLQKTMDLPSVPPQRLTPREAAMVEYRCVLLQEAQGLIAGEAITPYPPGIPLILPGEELTAEVIACVAACKQQGQHMSGMADSTLETIRVVWK